MTIAETARLEQLDASMSAPEKKEHRKKLYSNVLQVLKLKVKQLDLLLELVESLAYQEMRAELEKLGHGVPVDYYRNTLQRYIPWKMTPKDTPVRRPFTMVSGLRVRKGFNIGVLKGQVAALQKTLNTIVDIDAPEEPDEKP